MSASWLVLRAEFRTRWRTWLMLALIAGMFSGVVQAATAGARRTDSAYPSLVAWSDAPDVILFSFPGQSRTFAHFSLAAAGRLPQVTQSVALAGYTLADPAAAFILAPETSVVPGQFWHRKILAGRLPNPARGNEVDISFTLAQAEGLAVGGTLRTSVLAASHHLDRISLRIVGIDAAPSEFPPQTGTGTDYVWATPAFYRAHSSGFGVSPGVALRLRHGPADLPAIGREVRHLALGKVTESYPLATQAANTERSIHLQAVALWLLAGLLAVLGLLVLGQLLARLSFLDGPDNGTLLALGISRRGLLAVSLARAGVIGLAGGVAGALLAVAVSPVLPVGLARIAEPYPGPYADGPVLGLGLAGTVLAVTACAAWPAWRAAQARLGRAVAAGPGQRRGSRAAAGATSSISSVTALVGIRLALQPGAGRTAVPVRSTVASAVIGVAALTAALVFSASLGHLLTTPRLYGVTWNGYISNAGLGGISQAADSMASDRAVAAWAAGYSGAPLTVQGVRADAIALLPGHHGSLMPVLTQGHLPRGPGQLTVGQRTLAAVHAHLGERLEVSLAGFRPRRLTIVGSAVFPTMGDALGLGKGAALTVGGLRALLPAGLPAPPLDTLLVRLRPSAVSGPAALSQLADREARLGPFITEGPVTPTDLVNFGQVQDLPLLLGIALSVLALITLAHLLLTSVRRRRRDFAVLRTLGFTRGQVRSSVSWQASTLSAAALLLGIPAGILGGRAAWLIFAHQLGIEPVMVVPAVALAVLAAAGLVLSAAIAAIPGESAARARPASILRSE